MNSGTQTTLHREPEFMQLNPDKVRNVLLRWWKSLIQLRSSVLNLVMLSILRTVIKVINCQQYCTLDLLLVKNYLFPWNFAPLNPLHVICIELLSGSCVKPEILVLAWVFPPFHILLNSLPTNPCFEYMHDFKVHENSLLIFWFPFYLFSCSFRRHWEISPPSSHCWIATSSFHVYTFLFGMFWIFYYLFYFLRYFVHVLLNISILSVINNLPMKCPGKPKHLIWSFTYHGFRWLDLFVYYEIEHCISILRTN